jgi:hypothetical protein
MRLPVEKPLAGQNAQGHCRPAVGHFVEMETTTMLAHIVGGVYFVK